MTINLDLTDVESTYKQNNYGDLFYSLVRTLKPRLVVEFGTYQGYSGMHLAAGLRDNPEVESKLHLIDLWDDYSYRHCSEAITIENFTRNGLLTIPHCKVWFDHADVFTVGYDGYGSCEAVREDAPNRESALIPENSIDLLHIDISNCAEILRSAIKTWLPKLTPGATIIVEGGSVERDAVSWMIEYNRAPIRPWLDFGWAAEYFNHVTFDPFPSVTVMRRK